MRRPLQKNEFLLQFEELLKKYGYDTVYCRGEILMVQRRRDWTSL